MGLGNPLLSSEWFLMGFPSPQPCVAPHPSVGEGVKTRVHSHIAEGEMRAQGSQGTCSSFLRSQKGDLGSLTGKQRNSGPGGTFASWILLVVTQVNLSVQKPNLAAGTSWVCLSPHSLQKHWGSALPSSCQASH